MRVLCLLSALSALILASCSIPSQQGIAPSQHKAKVVILSPTAPENSQSIVEAPPVLKAPPAVKLPPRLAPVPTPHTALAAVMDEPTTSHSHETRFLETSAGGLNFSILSYDSNAYYLALADQPVGQKWLTAKQACLALNGVAAINGGFFGADGQPLGLVRSNATSTGRWTTASSLTSGVYQYHYGKSSLRRASAADKNAQELLQAGPFLVENHNAVKGLASDRSAQRSILLWDGQHHFAIAQSSSATLSQLAQAIKRLPAHLPKKYALNLDGGRSCDLYISANILPTPVNKSHWLKSNVRNYLVLRKK